MNMTHTFLIWHELPKVSKSIVEAWKDNNNLAESMFQTSTRNCQEVKLTKGRSLTKIEAKGCSCSAMYSQNRDFRYMLDEISGHRWKCIKDNGQGSKDICLMPRPEL